MPVSFLETPKDELQNIVTINCLGTLKVTQIVAPILKQRKAWINPDHGFLRWLDTYSLPGYLLRQQGLPSAMEQCSFLLLPWSKVRRPSLLIPNARNFVKAALGKVGLGGYQTAPNTYTPWWSHSFMLWLIENIPGVNSPVTIWYNKKMHLDIRRRALRKQAREAKKQLMLYGWA
ncbi:hypothetical protein J3459_006812 [Metarhizium acridum]|nr:hypothetical protein J3459_006812 [Metarhizium acridum]